MKFEILAILFSALASRKLRRKRSGSQDEEKNVP